MLPAGDNKFAAGTVPGVQKMIDTMAACGVAKPHVIYYQPNDSSITASMVQLRSEGVTSLIFYPAGDEGAGTPQLAAQKASYYPEWVTFGPGPYVMANLLAGAKRETAQTFGVASWSKILSPAQQPWSQAFTSVGGVEGGGHLLAGGKGFYEELQLLASGIQMAGPKLTTETWSAALTAIAFPNPGAGTTPSYQAHVGFANGKHEMISDFAGWWFDPSATNVEQIQATAVHDYDYSNGFCYVDLGSRWNADSWAPEDRFLHGGCR